MNTVDIALTVAAIAAGLAVAVVLAALYAMSKDAPPGSKS